MTRPTHAHRRWLIALAVSFAILGGTWGAWLTRLPTIRDTLGYSLADMSLLLLMPSIGSLLGLLTAGRLVTQVGDRPIIVLGIGMMTFTLPTGTLALFAGIEPLAYLLYVFFGVGFGLADVAVNVSGSKAERVEGRSRMSMLHAGFSVGGIVSVAIGALAESLKWSVTAHQAVYLAVSFALLIGLARWINHDPPPPLNTRPDEFTVTATGAIPVQASARQFGRGRPAAPGGRGRVWSDARVLILGIVALSGSLGDGVAADWMPLAFIDEYAMRNDRAVLMLTLMFTGELIVRLIGDRLVVRFGRVPVLRMSLAIGVGGVLLVALSPVAWLAVPGALLWGVGVALTFPLGVSAAADRPEVAARAVAAVSTISYTAYVAGPVVFGLLGDAFGLRVAFVILATILGVGCVLSGWARERS